MKRKLYFLLFFLIVVSSCSKDEVSPELESIDYDTADIIAYFKDIALGFEFGNASSITRKWNSEMRIFIGGEPNAELIEELESINTEINELVTDGFRVSVVNDSLQSNYYIFFGSGDDYTEIYPGLSNFVQTNLGLFSVSWNGQNQLTSGHMYVDIVRANSTAQKHLLREELTQSLGLAKDSPLYSESIFQSSWTTTTEYALIDRDLIRLLYHPEMSAGLDENQVDEVLRNILNNEQ